MTRALWTVWKKRIASYVIFVFIVSAIAVTIVWRYPLDREIALSSVRDATYDYQLELPTFSDQVESTVADLAPARVFLGAFVETAMVNPRSGKAIDTEVTITGTPETADLSLLPDSTRIAGNRNDSAGNWIDIGHNVAHQLDLKVGDVVVLPLGFAEEDPEFRVRGIYAVSGLEGQRLAVASGTGLEDVFSQARGEIDYFYAWTEGASAQDLSQFVASQPYAERLSNSGISAENWLLKSSDESLSRALHYTQSQLGLVRLLAAAGSLLLVAVLWREIRHSKKTLGLWSGTLDRLGVSAKLTRSVVYCFYAAGGSVALLGGVAVARLVYSGWFSSIVVPPALEPLWVWLAVAALVIPFVAFLPLLANRGSEK